MPDRINAWGVFDLFDTSDGEQVFLGVVTDTQWAVFGRAFDLGGLANDPRLANNNLRVQARDWMLPALREIVAALFGEGPAGGVRARGAALRADRQAGAAVRRPASARERRARDLTLDNGETTPVPLLPLLLDGRHLKPRMPLAKAGEHNALLAQRPRARQARCAQEEMIDGPARPFRHVTKLAIKSLGSASRTVYADALPACREHDHRRR